MTETARERAAQLFRAMGDVARLRTLELLARGELCVTDIVRASSEKFSTVSQRLRTLRNEGLVVRRRAGTHLFYALADRHVADLIHNVLAHASELEVAAAPQARAAPEISKMNTPHTHTGHSHQHGPNCGHTAVEHNGHIDYLHDGHLHHPTGTTVEEHRLEATSSNAACTPDHDCGQHEKSHQHGPGCGHEAVPHGEHTDYLVDGHLHHPHNGHCDDHGKVRLA